MQHLDAFTRAYLECALWSTNDESTPSGGEPLESRYSIDDLAPETLENAIADCKQFQADNAEAIAQWPSNSARATAERAGYDFWLTRNHHGAGFWVGDWPNGDALTAAADMYGEIDLYVGDDGLIYN